MSLDDDDGIWIGVDLGTSNCACAVWDSARGGSKWMRLANIATERRSDKHGRIVPSAAMPVTGDRGERITYEISSNEEKISALVGSSAVSEHGSDSNAKSSTLIRSVKRILGKRFEDLDDGLLKSLPYDVISSGNDISVRVKVEGESDDVLLTPLQITATLLSAMRVESERYLHKYAMKKNMEIPGNHKSKVKHAVIGVPAHFSSTNRTLVVEAARLAGFDGSVTTMVESTAAALAYGLTFNGDEKSTILVVDMGGGTTDITICTRGEESTSFEVATTEGDGRLGGDDIDQLLAAHVIGKSDATSISNSLLQTCREAKEVLCSGTEASVSILVDENQTISVTLSDVEKSMQPWLERARELILTAVRRYRIEHLGKDDDASDDITQCIDEVILVGGTTRIPTVRRMLRDEKNLKSSLFGHVSELCTSLDPMGSVAQGLAVQAALQSKLIPEHELRSALMLDSLPHAIGVDVGSDRDAAPSMGNFRCLLPKNSKLPARGNMTFQLADSSQPGVTVRAVELVDEDGTLVPLGSFNFLLRKLAGGNGVRTLQIGMMVGTDGGLTVSAFDEKDPEQVFKRKHFIEKKETVGENGLSSDFGYLADLFKASGKSTGHDEDDNLAASDMVMLVSVCIGLMVLYVGVKIMFAELPLGEDAARIL